MYDYNTNNFENHSLEKVLIMNIIKKILKEPLVHFLLLGVLLFALYIWINPESTGHDERIVVDTGQIKHISERFAKRWNRAPTQNELKTLIDDYVMTEIYYREAVSLGLDQNDPVIKRRMRQKVEFMTKDTLSILEVDDKNLQAYLDAYPDRFSRDAFYTFDQIYIDPNKHYDNLQNYIDSVKEQLSRSGTAQTGSSLIPQHYDHISRSRINGELGRDFAKQLDSVTIAEWSGPVQSGLGVHFVKVSERKPSEVVKLEEVREIVLGEYMREKRRETLARQRKRMLEKYQVIIDLNSTMPVEADVK